MFFKIRKKKRVGKVVGGAIRRKCKNMSLVKIISCVIKLAQARRKLFYILKIEH